MTTQESQTDELAARVEALPGVAVESTEDGERTRLVFTVPDVATALRLEWPTLLVLGLPTLAIIVQSIIQLSQGGPDAPARITVLIFVAPVLLILAFVILYWRRKSRRIVELGEDVIVPGPWMLAQGGKHRFERSEIIRLQLVRRGDTITRIMHGHIVVETAFHRATFGGHLTDAQLDVLWEYVVERTGLESIRIPWKRILGFSTAVGLVAAGATFVGADALLRVGPRPQIVHVFGSMTVGAVVFGLILGAWRRQLPTLGRLDIDT